MNRNTEFLTNIRRILRLHDTMLKSVCNAYHLTLIETTIISFLHNNPGKDTAADIAELCMLSKGNVSQAVESLIQKSLLYRQQDTENRRKIHLSLSSSSCPIAKEIESILGKLQKNLFAGFSEEEQRQLSELSNRFRENSKTVIKEEKNNNEKHR